LQVDPNDPNHLYAGLEEVYESHDAGATWQTVGPYWNFSFACWSIDPSKQSGTCSQTTHSDQHAVAIGTYHAKTFVYAGGDGGDTLVDPANGCNIAEEYTNLNVWVTNDCGANVSTDPSTETEYNVPPNDGVTGNARFIAPLAADAKNPSAWVAGGEHVAV